jgi:hypothetical protein
MRTIFKTKLDICDFQTVELPQDFKILHFIGFELSKEYFDKAVKRIKAEQAQLTLF